MIFRLTQELNAKIKTGTLRAHPLHENPFADWSCRLFTADRTQYILLSNTKSLYSTVMNGKGITNDRQFIDCALSSIRALLEKDGQDQVHDRFISPAVASVQFAKALNRSVTGSMTDLLNHATFWLTRDQLSLQEVTNKLNDVLLSALARSKAFPYGKPRDAFKAMVDGAGS